MSEISKQGETDIWNEITESTLPYNNKIKLLNRLRKNKIPKYKIQRNIEDFLKITHKIFE